MENLELISKKLEANGIKVTSIGYSEDNFCDDEVTLTDGFHIQVGSNYYGLWRDNGDDTYTDLGTFTTLKNLILKFKSNGN